MTVKELINLLNKVENKNDLIFIYDCQDGQRYKINTVDDSMERLEDPCIVDLNINENIW